MLIYKKKFKLAQVGGSTFPITPEQSQCWDQKCIPLYLAKYESHISGDKQRE